MLNSEERRLARINLRMNDYKDARSLGDLIAASQLLDDVFAELDGLDAKTHYEKWSRYYYEKAYLLKMLGQYDRAVEAFDQSKAAADIGNDHIRSWYAQYLADLTQYLWGRMLPEDFYAVLLRLKTDFDGIQDIKPSARPMVDSISFNFLNRLARTAFEVGKNDDFDHWVEETLNHDILVQNLGRNSVSHDLIAIELKYHIAIMEQDYNRAVGLCSQYIRVDDGLLPSKLIAPLDENIFAFVNNKSEQFAKDFRDYGRVILNLDLPNTRDAARSVFEQGLTHGDGFGNKRYADDMRVELAKL